MIIATTLIMLLCVLLTYPLTFHVKSTVEVSKLCACFQVVFCRLKVFDEQVGICGLQLVCSGSVNQTVNMLDLPKSSFNIGRAITVESLQVYFCTGMLSANYAGVLLSGLLAFVSASVASANNVSCCCSSEIYCGYGFNIVVNTVIKISLLEMVIQLIKQGVKNGQSTNQ